MKRSRELLVLVGILMIGSLVRGLYLSEIVHSPDFDQPGVDAGFHDYWARGLVMGNWSPPKPYRDPLIRSTPYFRPPGYPYFLALIYLLVGPSYLAARIVQVFLGIVNCLLAYLLARKWFGGRVGLIFAGLMSVYWIFIYFEGELVEPVLLVGLALSLIYVLSLWTEKITLWRCLGAGVLAGLFALVRPNILLFAPAVLGWLLWILLRRRERRRFPFAALGFIAGAVAAIAPAAVRNYVVAHDFVLISSNGGINLFLGNNDYAEGRFINIPGLGRFETCYDYPRIVGELEKGLGRPLKHSEVSKYFTGRAIRYAVSHPLRVLRLAGTKALLFWGPAEVAHNKVEQCERIHSRILRYLPGSFPVVLSLSVVGTGLLFLDVRRRRGRKDVSPASVQRQYEVSILMLLFIAAYFASFLPFFITAQYRVPVIPFLLLLGSYGLDRAGGFVSHRDFTKAAGWLFSWLILYGLASTNFAGYELDTAKWHFDRGVCYGRRGQTDRAISEYSEALRINPGCPNAHYNLGNALVRQGRIDAAIVHYREALRLEPDRAQVHGNLGNALHRRGRLDEAVAEYRKAIGLDPDVADTHYNLGMALAAQGKLDEAIDHYSTTLRIKRDFWQAHYNLGLVLAGQGKTDDAIREYREALRINPNLAEAHNSLAIALYLKGNYAEAWKEVHVCRSYGVNPRADFLKALSEKMAEPKE